MYGFCFAYSIVAPFRCALQCSLVSQTDGTRTLLLDVQEFRFSQGWVMSSRRTFQIPAARHRNSGPHSGSACAVVCSLLVRFVHSRVFVVVQLGFLRLTDLVRNFCASRSSRWSGDSFQGEGEVSGQNFLCHLPIREVGFRPQGTHAHDGVQEDPPLQPAMPFDTLDSSHT